MFTAFYHQPHSLSLSLFLSSLLSFIRRQLLQPLILLHAHIPLEHRSRELNRLRSPPIRDPAKTAHGAQHRGIDEVALLIDRVLAHPEPEPLQQDHAPADLAGRGTALELADALYPALGREHGLANARRAHRLRVVHGRQPADGPLREPRGRVNARRVGRLDKVLADDVHRALAVRGQVAQGVLGLGQRPGHSESENRRVRAHDVKVREGRQIERLLLSFPLPAILGARARGHEPDGPRGDARDQQLVVEGRGPAWLVWVDGDVLLGRGARVDAVGA